jgi:iron(III) transport system ATP-binding protein
MYLILDHLSKSFPAPTRGTGGEVTAVNDVSLRIDKGEFVTLLGPSGCGKTTTLRLIAGFEMPTQGHISLDGRSLDSVPPNRRDMAMVFQSYALFPHLSVFENIAYGLRLKKLTTADMRRQIAEALRLTALTGLEQRAPNQLSGGQQQRVALARALVMAPKVLLFDEPLSNLDAKLREQMRAEIRRIQQTLGITSVYVTHDQAEAMTLSDRIVVMHQGRIVQIGTASEIYRQPASTFVADFIGRANFLPAHVVGTSPEGDLDLEVLGRVLRLPRPQSPPRPGDRVTLLARPEAVLVGRCGDGYPGRVRRTAYLGPVVEYDIDVAEMVLVATQYDPREVYPVGTEVRVQLATEALYLLPFVPSPSGRGQG